MTKVFVDAEGTSVSIKLHLLKDCVVESRDPGQGTTYLALDYGYRTYRYTFVNSVAQEILDLFSSLKPRQEG